MALDVVDADKRLAQAVAQCLGEREAHKQRAHQAGRVGYGNQRQVRPGDARFRQGRFHYRDNCLHVGAGGEFRHDSAILSVNHLRRHDAGEDGRPPADHACRCLVTRCFDAEAERRRVVQRSSAQVVRPLSRSPRSIVQGFQPSSCASGFRASGFNRQSSFVIRVSQPSRAADYLTMTSNCCGSHFTRWKPGGSVISAASWYSPGARPETLTWAVISDCLSEAILDAGPATAICASVGSISTRWGSAPAAVTGRPRKILAASFPARSPRQPTPA